MKTDGSDWDIDLLKDIFTDRDFNLILSVPVKAMYADSWFWNGEKLGQYSVKSAYRSIQEGKVHLQHEVLLVWNKLRNTKIPQKVKVFMWRALSNYLPTKDQLTIRRVNVNQYCHVCNIDFESVDHIVIQCSFAIRCWDHLPFVDVDHTVTFVKWMEKCSHRYSKDLFEKIRLYRGIETMLYGIRKDQILQNLLSQQISPLINGRLLRINRLIII